MCDEESEEGDVEFFFEFFGEFGDEGEFGVSVPEALFLGVDFEVAPDPGGEP